MFFDSFADLIAMGGHGPYVWTCYAIATCVILFNLLSPLLKTRQFFQEQQRRLRREEQRQQSPSESNSQL